MNPNIIARFGIKINSIIMNIISCKNLKGIHFAASTNSMKCLRRLMQVIPGYINIQMINGVTPVYLGIFQINMILHGIKSSKNF